MIVTSHRRALRYRASQCGVLIASAVVTGIAIILAGQLAMPTAMPDLFPPHSNTFMYEAAQDELFSFEKYPVPSQFIWGIEPGETSKTGQRGLGIAPNDEEKIMPIFFDLKSNFNLLYVFTNFYSNIFQHNIKF